MAGRYGSKIVVKIFKFGWLNNEPNKINRAIKSEVFGRFMKPIAIMEETQIN